MENHVRRPPQIAGDAVTLILGLDPSLTAYGWAVVAVHDGAVINAGCVRTQPAKAKRHAYVGDDDTRRVREITGELLRRVRSRRPGAIAYETSGGAQSARAARALGIACGITGAIIQCAGVLDVPVVDIPVTAREAKSVTGSPSASKDDVVAWASARVSWLHLEPRVAREAIADAVAVAEYARGLAHVRGLR